MTTSAGVLEQNLRGERDHGWEQGRLGVTRRKRLPLPLVSHVICA